MAATTLAATKTTTRTASAMASARTQAAGAEPLGGGGRAPGGGEDVARARGEEVGHVEAARPAHGRRHARLEQQALQQLGLGLVLRGGDADELPLGVGRVDLAGARGRLVLARRRAVARGV